MDELTMLRANAQMTRHDLERMRGLIGDDEHERVMLTRYGVPREQTRLYVAARVEELERSAEWAEDKAEEAAAAAEIDAAVADHKKVSRKGY